MQALRCRDQQIGHLRFLFCPVFGRGVAGSDPNSHLRFQISTNPFGRLLYFLGKGPERGNPNGLQARLMAGFVVGIVFDVVQYDRKPEGKGLATARGGI